MKSAEIRPTIEQKVRGEGRSYRIDLEVVNQMPWKTREILMKWCKENGIPGYLFQLNWAPYYITCFKYKGSEKHFGFAIGKPVVEKIRVRTKSSLPVEVLEFVK